MALPYEKAPLEREFVERVLEHVRKGQTKAGFGVTLQEDHSGAWGPIGRRYLTVRFGNPKCPADLVEVMMEVVSVTSSMADEDHNTFLNEDK